MAKDTKDKKVPKRSGAKVTVNEAWCKKCGICIAFCPTAVFTADDFGLPIVDKPEKCIKCMLCVIRCPDFCIEVEPLKE
jgi:2-oxoglutarate ferredoxin oxidoreductase subunit delta|tara:strand:- start:422 stop:658 length:237 start_codon:yes stop_codon:yes gene_type:complete